MVSDSSLLIMFVLASSVAGLARYWAPRIATKRGYGRRKRRVLVTTSMLVSMATVELLFLFGLHWWTLPVLIAWLAVLSLFWMAFAWLIDVVKSILHLQSESDAT